MPAFSWTAPEDGLADESTAVFHTAAAPSFPDPDSGLGREDLSAFDDLRPGKRIGEFDLISELGRGAFGVVFLARQTSLDRQVALKVTPHAGSEGGTLAQLEHENIVQVYSEVVDVLSDRRLLCMQYVAGTTLEFIIERLQRLHREEWCGRAILEIIDSLPLRNMAFDPTALRDREMLARSDYVEAVCWIGTRLAEALACAHDRGVLHRDVKPANVLISQYGRPLLADFNLAFRTLADGRTPSGAFGGTLAYMAPEHLDAFNTDHTAGPEAVDARSDIYSLAVMLYELLHGRLPFEFPERTSVSPGALNEMSRLRRERSTVVQTTATHGDAVLARTLNRCLEPDPADRPQKGADVAEALEGCRALRQAESALPPLPPYLALFSRRTFLWLIVLGLLPHLFGSIVQITYNSVRIVGELTEPQRLAFVRTAIAYNIIVYPLCLAWLARHLVPVERTWSRIANGKNIADDRVLRVRRMALDLPLRAALVGCIGWLPGAIIFPVAISTLSEPLPGAVWGHFAVSFVLAGLIALTYSFFAAQWVIVRLMYVRLWTDGRGFRNTARNELQPAERRARRFQRLAGAIPLLGAIVMVTVSPLPDAEEEYTIFRILVTLLILLGMLGVLLTNAIQRHLSKTLTALTRPE